MKNLPCDLQDIILSMCHSLNTSSVNKEIKTKVIIDKGDFSNHKDDFMKNEGPTAYDVITELNAWPVMAKDPPTDTGYTFSRDPILVKIQNMIDERRPVHSGASMGFLMQHMHLIASEGWTKYYKQFMS